MSSKGTTQQRRVVAAVAALVAVAGVTCKKGKRAAALAELIEIASGTVDKSQAGASWLPAEKGAEFSRGDALRTSENGKARVRISESLLDVGPSTIVSFGEHVGVEGEITAVEGTSLNLAIGEVELVAGAVIRLSGTSRHGLRFEVLVGTAVVEQNGVELSVAPGEKVSLDPNGALAREGIPDAGPPDAATEELPVTIVATVSGRVSATIPGEESARKLKGTSELVPGAKLALKRRARVELARGDDRATVYGPAEATVGERGALVSISKGKLDANAKTRDVVIAVPGGTLRLIAGPGDGSAASLAVSRKATSVELTGGRAALDGAKGASEPLRHGERASLSPKGQIDFIRRAPEHADATLAKDATIHTPDRIADVAIDFSEQCPDEALVELGKNARFKTVTLASRGTRSANLRLKPGVNHYRVRCIEGGVLDEKVARTGRIKVERDAGTRQLASVPPTSTVEADGRRYTVLYQNKLPAISFRWRDAPASDSYSLILKRKKAKPVKKSGKSSTFSLSSGVLREGEYTFQFESEKGSSKVSRLRVAFDNAASSGYINSPRPNAIWQSDKVRVAGATLSGWQVKVDGRPLALDRHQRFDTRIPRPESGRIAIEFSHPRRGSHVYLRRSSDAP